MNPVLDDPGAREQSQREERRRAKLAAAQHRSDVQEMFGTEAGRRVLWQFMQDSAADISPLRSDAMTTAHAIGWADAAGWWLNAMRAHCPEREGQMRAEARKRTRDDARDDDDNEDSDDDS